MIGTKYFEEAYCKLIRDFWILQILLALIIVVTVLLSIFVFSDDGNNNNIRGEITHTHENGDIPHYHEYTIDTNDVE